MQNFTLDRRSFLRQRMYFLTQIWFPDSPYAALTRQLATNDAHGRRLMEQEIVNRDPFQRAQSWQALALSLSED